MEISDQPFKWVWSKIAWLRNSEAKQAAAKPLRFIQNDFQSFWGPLTRERETGTQVFGYWHVTSISDRNIFLLKVRFAGHPSEYASVRTEMRDDNNRPTDEILANQTGRVAVNFRFFPAIAIEGELAGNVIFTDNYGDEYQVYSTFPPLRP